MCPASPKTGPWTRSSNGKIVRTGAEAARRKFTPEFINRLDKIVTFKPLGTNELRKILDIELNMVQQTDLQHFAREIIRLQNH